jgi:hypothetical protein
VQNKPVRLPSKLNRAKPKYLPARVAAISVPFQATAAFAVRFYPGGKIKSINTITDNNFFLKII